MPLLPALLVAFATITPPSDSTLNARNTVLAGPRRSDPLWTHDIMHFVGPVVGTPSMALTLNKLGVERRTARWLTAGTAAAIIFLKEYYDQRVGASMSTRDFLLGGAGTAAGFVITERLWRRESPPGRLPLSDETDRRVLETSHPSSVPARR